MNNQYTKMQKTFHTLAAMSNGSADEVSGLFDNTELVEVIVKYNGDIDSVARELNAVVEILFQGYAIITINPKNINQLYSYTQIESLELPRKLFIESSFNLISTCVRSVQNSNSESLTGAGVIVAIIDYGIDYTHQDFRNEDGTSRILYLWDQTESGTPPAGFAAGAEYSQQQLNEALKAENPFLVVPSRDISGHGTAVAGIAAGNGRQSKGENTGVAPAADLIVVKVGTRGFTSFARTTELMRAVKYVIDKARMLNQPLAINISFGMNNGSHRGDSLFESYLSDISTEWKNAIIIPTGNEGSAGHHFAAKLISNNIREVDFFTASGISQFYVSMWKDFTDSLTVEIIFPDGLTSGVIGIENQIKNVQIENVLLTVIYSQPSHFSVRQEIFFNFQAKTGVISAGLWKIRIISGIIVDGNIEMWLPTTEEVTINTRFSNPVSWMTLTIPSSAERVIKVSGYNDRIGSISEFSGTGSNNAEPPKPDIAAPAFNILTVKSGGGYDSFSGTSMAAPFVTGSAALMMQWGIVQQNDPFLYGERIKAFLRLGANRKSTIIYPNLSYGYGTLCLQNTIDFLKRYKWGGNNQWLQT